MISVFLEVIPRPLPEPPWIHQSLRRAAEELSFLKQLICPAPLYLKSLSGSHCQMPQVLCFKSGSTLNVYLFLHLLPDTPPQQCSYEPVLPLYHHPGVCYFPRLPIHLHPPFSKPSKSTAVPSRPLTIIKLILILLLPFLSALCISEF